jgi:hypothetical protein
VTGWWHPAPGSVPVFSMSRRIVAATLGLVALTGCSKGADPVVVEPISVPPPAATAAPSAAELPFDPVERYPLPEPEPAVAAAVATLPRIVAYDYQGSAPEFAASGVFVSADCRENGAQPGRDTSWIVGQGGDEFVARSGSPLWLRDDSRWRAPAAVFPGMLAAQHGALGGGMCDMLGSLAHVAVAADPPEGSWQDRVSGDAVVVVAIDAARTRSTLEHRLMTMTLSSMSASTLPSVFNVGVVDTEPRGGGYMVLVSRGDVLVEVLALGPDGSVLSSVELVAADSEPGGVDVEYQSPSYSTEDLADLAPLFRTPAR